MNLRYLVLAIAIMLAGCQRQKEAAAEAEKQRLETERVQLDKEKAKLAAEIKAAEAKRLADEQVANEAEKARLAAETTRLAQERDRLLADKDQLEAERARLMGKHKPPDAALAVEAGDASARTDDGRAALATERARNEAEWKKLEEVKAKLAAEHAAMVRALEETRARQETERRLQEAAKNQTVAVFFDPLATMGDWFDTDRYGFVWRPSAAADPHANWRPYVDGRWHVTDYGWTWESHEPFGWAVYHYGRWARIPGVGWAWVPGSEWAPAWVAWRWHRPREYVGWAPLPPEAKSEKGFDSKVDAKCDLGPERYTFVATNDFDAPTYVGKTVPESQLREIMPLTVNMTWIVPRGDGRMACGGPDTGLIHTELREKRQDLDIHPFSRIGLQLMNSAPQTAAPDVMNAGALMLFAPPLKSGPALGKPAKIKARLEVKSVNLGWDPSEPWETDVWRGRIRAEAAAAEAAEQAAKNRPPAPVAPTPTPTPPPATTPPPAPVNRPLTTPPGAGGLAPSRLQPSSGLFPRK